MSSDKKPGSSPVLSIRPQDEKALGSDTIEQNVKPLEAIDLDKPVEDVRARVSTPIVSEAIWIPHQELAYAEQMLTSYQWIIIVATMMSSTFLFSLDNSIVAEIQPAILSSLGGVEKLGWLGVAFVLGTLATILLWGKIMGVFSVKWSYIVSIIIFDVGSAICGAAPTMDAMIIGRALAGVGGAGMYVGCLSLLSLTTSLRERPIYMASIGFTWGTGTVLGPIVGGAFAENEYTTWRWSFYINLCVGALFAPACLFLLPRSDPQKGVSIIGRLRQIDYVGAILSIGFLTPFVMAINFGGVIYAWESGQMIALWVVSGVVFIAFCLQQKFAIFTTKKNRLFPADFLRNYDMWLLFAAMSCASTCVFTPTYFIPLFFQFVRGDEPLEAGVRLLPFICVMVFCGLLSGGLMGKLGYYMPWYLLGGCLTLIGGTLMYTVDQGTSDSRLYGYMAITGAGAGLYIQASYAVAQAKVAPDRSSDAVGLISFAQYLGITLALAISSAVFQTVAFDELTTLLPDLPPDTVRNIVQGTSSGLLETMAESKINEVLDAIVHAISQAYVLVLTAGALTVICACLMKVSAPQHIPLSLDCILLRCMARSTNLCWHL